VTDYGLSLGKPKYFLLWSIKAYQRDAGAPFSIIWIYRRENSHMGTLPRQKDKCDIKGFNVLRLSSLLGEMGFNLT
jgi:hypothetical protein